ncbi:MAG: hypothetical protein ACI8UO_006248 [Verrucomicrobiales bacterium]|jgi:hypothetical protein
MGESEPEQARKQPRRRRKSSWKAVAGRIIVMLAVLGFVLQYGRNEIYKFQAERFKSRLAKMIADRDAVVEEKLRLEAELAKLRGEQDS